MTTGSPIHVNEEIAGEVSRLLVPRIVASDLHLPAFRGPFDVQHEHEQGIAQSISEVLTRFCVDNSVLPSNVARCISMLRLGWCVLHAGSPVLMMGYSERRNRFIASVDAGIPDDWRGLTESKALLLLLLLASEEGMLPADAEAWGVIRFRDPMLVEFAGADHVSVDRYRSYAAGDRSRLDDYDAQLARAFFSVRDFMRL